MTSGKVKLDFQLKSKTRKCCMTVHI